MTKVGELRMTKLRIGTLEVCERRHSTSLSIPKRHTPSRLVIPSEARNLLFAGSKDAA